VRVSLAVVLVGVLAAGCGSGGSSKRDTPKPGTLDAIWHRAGPAVALIPGTHDYAPGDVRISFLVVDQQGRVVARPRARVWLASGRNAVPFATATARLEPIGLGTAAAAGDVSSIYVARFRVRKPGHYWIVARPVGGRPIGGLRDVVVRATSESPSIGAKAYPSKTPTLATEPFLRLTTRRPPDLGLLHASVASTLRARKPFVLVFATPRYCQSRTCGPVVDVVDAARRRFAGRGIRFIHVEIYRDNNPAKGFNRWVQEWRLPSEPWTFLVGADGRIKDKFEGAISLAELSTAIRRHLDQKA
jgi:hypothetical protein